jgi:hypothetical protein
MSCYRVLISVPIFARTDRQAEKLAVAIAHSVMHPDGDMDEDPVLVVEDVSQ